MNNILLERQKNSHSDQLNQFKIAYHNHDLTRCQDILESVGIGLSFHDYFLCQFHHELRRGGDLK